jgi:hypothetical protein
MDRFALENLRDVVDSQTWGPGGCGEDGVRALNEAGSLANHCGQEAEVRTAAALAVSFGKDPAPVLAILQPLPLPYAEAEKTLRAAVFALDVLIAHVDAQGPPAGVAEPEFAEVTLVTDDVTQLPKRIELPLESRALAVLMNHPDWTDVRIAKELRCHRGSLYRLGGYKAARELLRQNSTDTMARGSKLNGELEAWDG